MAWGRWLAVQLAAVFVVAVGVSALFTLVPEEAAALAGSPLLGYLAAWVPSAMKELRR